MNLRIGTSGGNVFSLPNDLVTQTAAVLAKKGSGKSYTAAVMCEELLDAGQQVVIVDPTGAHWGLRSSADGKSAGFPIVVFGGDHADLPLEEGAGEVLARAVVEQRFSAILDLSLLRKGAANRFLCAFFETLYRLNRAPLHLIADEADLYAPQKPFGDEARTLGAIEDIVRRGRIRGIGCTLITQRPQVLNKNVLTQAEMLIALRLVHPKDIAPVMEWVRVHADEDRAADMLASLPSLPIGTAWFWSPGWGDLFVRVQVRARRTFDSGATPKAGEAVKAPKVLASIDVEKLGNEIKATVEKAKADDPRELKRRIAELERALASKHVAKPEVDRETLGSAEVAGQLRGRDEVMKHVYTLRDGLRDAFTRLNALLEKDEAWHLPPLEAKHYGQFAQKAGLPAKRRPPASPSPVQRRTSPAPATANGFTPNATQQRIIDAIAWYESIGNTSPSLTKIGAVALIDPTGGHFSNTVGPLSTAGLIERGDGVLRLTDEGRAIARVPESAATLEEYHETLRKRVRKMKSASGKTIELLDVIIAAGGGQIHIEEIGAQIGIDHTGGHFSNTIGPLGTAGLITRKDGLVTPTDVLFPEGLS